MAAKPNRIHNRIRFQITMVLFCISEKQTMAAVRPRIATDLGPFANIRRIALEKVFLMEL